MSEPSNIRVWPPADWCAEINPERTQGGGGAVGPAQSYYGDGCAAGWDASD